MVDTNPMDPTSYSTTPPADLARFGWAPGDYQCFRCDDCGRVFEGAKRCVRCRSCAEKMAAGCAIGNQQSDEGFQRVEGGRSSEGNQAPSPPTHPDDEWSIDALHGHMEHLFGEEDEFSKASADAIGWCLERIEALTAENARLTAEAEQLQTALADPQAVHLGMLSGGIAKPSLRNMLHLNGDNALKIWDEAVECRIELAGVQAERDRLKAEVERLTANVIDLSDQLKLEETCRIMREIEDDEELRRLCARDDDEVSPLDHDWYSRHRAAVEAAHAAAKEAQREAVMQELVDLGQAMQPELYSGAKEAAE